ncbi:MAG: hypothetical protein ABSG68_00230 [Thermoguttaceae bacterium]|jgi:hypothetical protein
MSADPEPRNPFQYSLRTFLIATTAVGVSAGLLGRLFLRDPELCLIIVASLSTAGPFALAIGTIIGIGVRGRRWGLTSWGVVLLLTPLVGIGAVIAARYFMGPGPSNLRMQSTQELLQQQLPNQIDQPWVWNEFEYRLKAGTLSQKDVDDAVKVLIAHMTTKCPQGWDQPLSWQNAFLSSAAQAGMISPPVLLDLCDAFYGPKPTVQPLPRLREGKSDLAINVKYGNPWNNQAGLGVELLWQVERVLLDGKPIEVRQSYKTGQNWSGSHQGTLTAGDHQLVVEVQCAYVDQDKLFGLNGGDLPIDRWPEARKSWKRSVSAPLKVYAAGVPIIALVTDPSQAPGPGGGIRVERFVVQADRDGKKKIILRAEFTPGPSPSLPLSYDVAVAIKGQAARLNLGQLWMVRSANGSTQCGNQLEGSIDRLDPSIVAADIILTPNPSHVEQLPDVTEIWGKKAILHGIPLERLDLKVKAAGSR